MGDLPQLRPQKTATGFSGAWKGRGTREAGATLPGAHRVLQVVELLGTGDPAFPSSPGLPEPPSLQRLCRLTSSLQGHT